VQYDFDKLTAPVLAHWAEDDDFANAVAAKIEPELKRRGKRYEFHRYPGTKHAFFNDQRPEVYDKKAADESWQRTIRFFEENL
jgi:carboxymethylenebutenolidase